MSSEQLTGRIRVLSVDDDPSVTWIISDGLNPEEFAVETCNDGRSAIQKFSEFHPDVLLVDMKMPGMDGIEVLQHVKRIDPTVSVIVISGHADTPVVVRAIQAGAEDFIVKPFDVEMLEITINKVMEKKDLKQRVKKLECELARQTARQDFIGDSPQMFRVRELVEQIASTDLNVLIRGETGTGKDVVARMIHNLSDRQRGPYVKVNCAALPGDLLESELFGHERGAFTGAYKSKPGRFELADKGTIFLDEIGEMPAQLQATLLQVLEHREFFRVGGTNNIKVDVRLVTATNIEIEESIREKKFRMDLFYRLNDITIHMPPLRERGEDIISLGQFFLLRHCEKLGRESWVVKSDNDKMLMSYAWPGNVRELESLMKRVAILGEDEICKHVASHQGESALLESVSGGAGFGPRNPDRLGDDYFVDKSLKEIHDEVVTSVESRAIELCLDKHGWNRKKTAVDLGVSYRCLLYKIQEYELKPQAVKDEPEAESMIA